MNYVITNYSSLSACRKDIKAQIGNGLLYGEIQVMGNDYIALATDDDHLPAFISFAVNALKGVDRAAFITTFYNKEDMYLYFALKDKGQLVHNLIVNLNEPTKQELASLELLKLELSRVEPFDVYSNLYAKRENDEIHFDQFFIFDDVFGESIHVDSDDVEEYPCVKLKEHELIKRSFNTALPLKTVVFACAALTSVFVILNLFGGNEEEKVEVVTNKPEIVEVKEDPYQEMYDFQTTESILPHFALRESLKAINLVNSQLHADIESLKLEQKGEQLVLFFTLKADAVEISALSNFSGRFGYAVNQNKENAFLVKEISMDKVPTTLLQGDKFHQGSFERYLNQLMNFWWDDVRFTSTSDQAFVGKPFNKRNLNLKLDNITKFDLDNIGLGMLGLPFSFENANLVRSLDQTYKFEMNLIFMSMRG